MNYRKIISITIFGIFSVLTIRAINSIPYSSISMYLLLEIISGPIAAMVLFRKHNWLRAIVGNLAFAGLFGLVQIGETFARAALYGAPLQYPNKAYVIQGIIALGLIAVFVIWYFVRGKVENDL